MNKFKLAMNHYKLNRAKKRSEAFAQNQLDNLKKPKIIVEPKPKKHPKFGFRM